MLIFVVLVPFTTHVSGDYSSVQIAVVLFHANMLILSLLFFCQWQYLLRHPSLMGPIPPDRATVGVVDRIKTPVSACVGILVSFYSPANSMWAYPVVPLGIYAIQTAVRTITATADRISNGKLPEPGTPPLSHKHCAPGLRAGLSRMPLLT